MGRLAAMGKVRLSRSHHGFCGCLFVGCSRCKSDDGFHDRSRRER